MGRATNINVEARAVLDATALTRPYPLTPLIRAQAMHGLARMYRSTLHARDGSDADVETAVMQVVKDMLPGFVVNRVWIYEGNDGNNMSIGILPEGQSQPELILLVPL